MKPGSALAGLVLNCMELSPSPPPPPAPLLLLLLLALAVDSRALSRSCSLHTTPPLTSNSVSSDCRQRRGGRGVDEEPERKLSLAVEATLISLGIPPKHQGPFNDLKLSKAKRKKLHSRLLSSRGKRDRHPYQAIQVPLTLRQCRDWNHEVLQRELAEEVERVVNLSRPSETRKSELQDEDVLSLTSSDPAASALLCIKTTSPREQEMADEGEEDIQPKPSQPCTAHKAPALVSLPFLPDLHNEMSSARIHRHQRAMQSHGWRGIDTKCSGPGKR
ncbi:hypothetical protein PO909_015194 [Leuciscus waleckii]